MTLFDTQWWIQYQKNFMLIEVFNSLGLQAVNIKWLSNYNQSQRISAEFVDLSIPNQKNFTAEILKQMENFFTQKLDFQSSTKFPYTHPIIFFPTDKYKKVGNVGKGQNVKNHFIESQKSEHRKFPLKGSERQKIRTTTTTYGVVPMDTKACGGLG